MIGLGLERGWPAYQALPLSHAGGKASHLQCPSDSICVFTDCTPTVSTLCSRQRATKQPGCCSVRVCNARSKTFSAMFAQSNIAHLSLAFAFIICFKIIKEVLPRNNSAHTFISLGFSKDIKWNLLCPEGLSLWSGADPMRSWAITIPTQGPNTRTSKCALPYAPHQCPVLS